MHFISSSNIPHNAVIVAYDPLYVLISYLMAAVAAGVALLVLDKTDISSPQSRLKGCFLGGLVLGVGIWTMHFTGMLAAKMEMEHTYNVGLTLLSMLFAALPSFAVFYNITNRELTFKAILLNAPLMGIGISAMHYTGMAAMEMKATIHYLIPYFWASIAIAIVSSGAAMVIMRYVDSSKLDGRRKSYLSLGAAIILASAISGMHYTGMAATIFEPFADCRFISNQQQFFLMVTVVIAFVLISILGVYLATHGFIEEKKIQKSGFSTPGTLITNLCILLVGASIAFLVNYQSKENYASALKSFKDQEAIKAQYALDTINNTFNLIHTQIATLSQLYVLRNNDFRVGLTPTEKRFIQNIHDKFDLIRNASLFVITTKFSPDVNKSDQGMIFYSNDFERFSEMERKAMFAIAHDHLKWYQIHYPLEVIEDYDLKLSRSAWIVPDGKEKVKHGVTKISDPMVVYSIPYYHRNGQLSGVINTVTLLPVLYNKLLSDNHVLTRTDGDQTVIYPNTLSGNLRGSQPFIKNGEFNPNFLYSAVLNLNVIDNNAVWKLWIGSKDDDFYNSEIVKNIQSFSILGYSVSIILTVLAIGLFNLITYNLRLEIDREIAVHKEKTEFLSNMSHELRTPMHAILSYSEMGVRKLEEGSQNAPQALVKYFNNIQIAGKRLLSLLNNLLDLAKLESGKMQFKFEPHDFKAVITHSLIELDSLLVQKKINPQVTYNSKETQAIFDREKMVQVIINLMSNAIKFSPENSEIRISLDTIQFPEKKVLFVSIEDEGVGIPEDECETVFDKFVQSSNTNSQAGGTGLGLSICKHIIETHGGRIWVKNGQHKGAIFQFTFPIHEREDI